MVYVSKPPAAYSVNNPQYRQGSGFLFQNSVRWLDGQSERFLLFP